LSSFLCESATLLLPSFCFLDCADTPSSDLGAPDPPSSFQVRFFFLPLFRDSQRPPALPFPLLFRKFLFSFQLQGSGLIRRFFWKDPFFCRQPIFVKFLLMALFLIFRSIPPLALWFRPISSLFLGNPPPTFLWETDHSVFSREWDFPWTPPPPGEHALEKRLPSCFPLFSLPGLHPPPQPRAFCAANPSPTWPFFLTRSPPSGCPSPLQLPDNCAMSFLRVYFSQRISPLLHPPRSCVVIFPP